MVGDFSLPLLVHFSLPVTACELLSAGKSSVTETAFACGFNDLSYFIRVFKRFQGVTPKQYGSR